MTRHDDCIWPGLALFLALVSLSGCGKTEYKDKPETLQAIDSCRGTVAEKDGYIKELEGRIGDLQKSAGSGEIVVTVTGDEIVIKPAKEPSGPSEPTGPKVSDEELYKSFVAQVQKARGSMQRCYTNALKKDSGLQARTVTLTVQVRFKSDGTVSKSTFKPNLSDAFDSCMGQVSGKWKLEGTRDAITFQQPITLSPQ